MAYDATPRLRAFRLGAGLSERGVLVGEIRLGAGRDVLEAGEYVATEKERQAEIEGGVVDGGARQVRERRVGRVLAEHIHRVVDAEVRGQSGAAGAGERGVLAHDACRAVEALVQSRTDGERGVVEEVRVGAAVEIRNR